MLGLIGRGCRRALVWLCFWRRAAPASEAEAQLPALAGELRRLEADARAAIPAVLCSRPHVRWARIEADGRATDALLSVHGVPRRQPRVPRPLWAVRRDIACEAPRPRR